MLGTPSIDFLSQDYMSTGNKTPSSVTCESTRGSTLLYSSTSLQHTVLLPIYAYVSSALYKV